MTLPEDLLEELTLGRGQGNRLPGSALGVSVLRELTPEDLPLLTAPPVSGQGQISVQKLRHSHHRLAELLVQGLENNEIAFVTGYDPAYISKLQSDPAFAELVSNYALVRKELFVDVIERMKRLGLDSLDALQEKLHDENETWTKRELMEMAELLLIKGQQVGQGKNAGGASSSGVAVNVTFVSTDKPGLVIEQKEAL